METEIIILAIVIVSTAVVHIVTLLRTRSRRGNIVSYYGAEIIRADEIKDLRHRAHKTCAIVFFTVLALILILFIIPFLLVRKREGKKLLPFL